MLRILDRDTHEKLLSKLDDKGRAGLFEKLAYLLTYADDGKAVPAEIKAGEQCCPFCDEEEKQPFCQPCQVHEQK